MKVGDIVKITKSPSKWFDDGEDVIVNHIWDENTVSVRKKDNSWRLTIKTCDLIIGELDKSNMDKSEE